MVTIAIMIWLLEVFGGSTSYSWRLLEHEKSEIIVLKPGDKFYVYRGLRHQMVALEDTELFEFSTQHFDDDSHRIFKGD